MFSDALKKNKKRIPKLDGSPQSPFRSPPAAIGGRPRTKLSLGNQFLQQQSQGPSLEGQWCDVYFQEEFPFQLVGSASAVNVLTETLYVFGGIDGFEPTNITWEISLTNTQYNPSVSHRELVCDNPPSPRSQAHMFLNHGDLLIIGGQSNRGNMLQDAWRCSLSRNRWSSFGTSGPWPPLDAGWASTHLPDGSAIYFFGESQLWRLSLEKLQGTWSEVLAGGVVPASMFGHSLVSTENELICFGGIAQNGRCTDEVNRFKISSSSWTTLSSNKGPSPRAFSCASLLNNSLLVVFGGSEANDAPGQSFNNLQAFDIRKKNWIKFEGRSPIAGRGMAHMHLLPSIVAGQYVLGVTGGNYASSQLIDVFRLERIPIMEGSTDVDTNEDFNCVFEFLDAAGYGDLKQKFQEEEVDDHAFSILKLKVSDEFLVALGLDTVGERVKFKSLLLDQPL